MIATLIKYLSILGLYPQIVNYVRTAAGDCRSAVGTTLSVTSGLKILTVVGGDFTSADIGKTIIVPGAGAAGVALKTTVAAVASATSITLTAAASTTLSAVSNSVVVGTDDTVAIQSALTRGGTISLRAGANYLTTDLVYRNTVADITIFGNGATLHAFRSTAINGISFSEATNIKVDGLNVDGHVRHGSLIGQAIAFRNPVRCTVSNSYQFDYNGTGVIMFNIDSDTISPYTLYGNVISNCTSDGNTVGQIGQLMYGLFQSAIINPQVKNINRSAPAPGYAVNLKGACIECHVIGGSAYNSEYGLVISDNHSTLACSAKGFVAKKCNIGATIGYATNCVIELVVDMESQGTTAFNITAGNDHCRVRLDVRNLAASQVAITQGDSDYFYFELTHDGTGGQIWTLGSGSASNQLNIVDYANGSTTPNMQALITDSSGLSTNLIRYGKDIVTQANGSSGTTLYFSGGAAATTRNSYIAVNSTNSYLNHRVNGVDVFQTDQGNSRIAPGADNTIACGASSRRWTQLFAATATIGTSDAREKTPVAPLSKAEIAAARALLREIGTFQFLSSVAEKGNTARRHVGMTVQRAIEIMEENGLDPMAYGFICYDRWDDQYSEGPDGLYLSEPAGDRYSFRAEELIFFILGGMQLPLLG